MGKKVCLDTNILGWYVKGYATKGQEGNVLKAKLLIEKYIEEKVVLFIPSVVVAEVIMDIKDQDERDAIVTFLSENFEVGNFDVICSLEYANFFNKMADKSFSTYRSENGISKSAMKHDWMIAVEASVNNCDEIISNNKKDFKNFIGDYIPIYDLDDATSNLTTMESLFDEVEDEE